MNDSEGVAFCPVRYDPFSHVQVADFSKVRYMEIVDSDDEAAQQGESEENQQQGDSANDVGEGSASATDSPTIPPAVPESPGKGGNPDGDEECPDFGAKTAPGNKKKNRKDKKKKKQSNSWDGDLGEDQSKAADSSTPVGEPQMSEPASVDQKPSESPAADEGTGGDDLGESSPNKKSKKAKKNGKKKEKVEKSKPGSNGKKNKTVSFAEPPSSSLKPEEPTSSEEKPAETPSPSDESTNDGGNDSQPTTESIGSEKKEESLPPPSESTGDFGSDDQPLPQSDSSPGEKPTEPTSDNQQEDSSSPSPSHPTGDLSGDSPAPDLSTASVSVEEPSQPDLSTDSISVEEPSQPDLPIDSISTSVEETSQPDLTTDSTSLDEPLQPDLPTDSTSVEELPQSDLPTDSVSVEEPSQPDLPIDSISTSVEETSQPDLTTDSTSVDEPLQPDLPTDSISVEEPTQPDLPPTDSTSVEELPQPDLPTNSVSVEELPQPDLPTNVEGNSVPLGEPASDDAVAQSGISEAVDDSSTSKNDDDVDNNGGDDIVPSPSEKVDDPSTSNNNDDVGGDDGVDGTIPSPSEMVDDDGVDGTIPSPLEQVDDSSTSKNDEDVGGDGIVLNPSEMVDDSSNSKDDVGVDGTIPSPSEKVDDPSTLNNDDDVGGDDGVDGTIPSPSEMVDNDGVNGTIPSLSEKVDDPSTSNNNDDVSGDDGVDGIILSLSENVDDSSSLKDDDGVDGTIPSLSEKVDDPSTSNNNDDVGGDDGVDGIIPNPSENVDDSSSLKDDDGVNGTIPSLSEKVDDPSTSNNDDDVGGDDGVDGTIPSSSENVDDSSSLKDDDGVDIHGTSQGSSELVEATNDSEDVAVDEASKTPSIMTLSTGGDEAKEQEASNDIDANDATEPEPTVTELDTPVLDSGSGDQEELQSGEIQPQSDEKTGGESKSLADLAEGSTGEELSSDEGTPQSVGNPEQSTIEVQDSTDGKTEELSTPREDSTIIDPISKEDSSVEHADVQVPVVGNVEISSAQEDDPIVAEPVVESEELNENVDDKQGMYRDLLPSAPQDHDEIEASEPENEATGTVGDEQPAEDEKLLSEPHSVTETSTTETVEQPSDGDLPVEKPSVSEASTEEITTKSEGEASSSQVDLDAGEKVEGEQASSTDDQADVAIEGDVKTDGAQPTEPDNQEDSSPSLVEAPDETSSPNEEIVQPQDESSTDGPEVGGDSTTVDDNVVSSDLQEIAEVENKVDNNPQELEAEDAGSVVDDEPPLDTSAVDDGASDTVDSGNANATEFEKIVEDESSGALEGGQSADVPEDPEDLGGSTKEPEIIEAQGTSDDGGRPSQEPGDAVPQEESLKAEIPAQSESTPEEVIQVDAEDVQGQSVSVPLPSCAPASEVEVKENDGEAQLGEFLRANRVFVQLEQSWGTLEHLPSCKLLGDAANLGVETEDTIPTDADAVPESQPIEISLEESKEAVSGDDEPDVKELPMTGEPNLVEDDTHSPQVRTTEDPQLAPSQPEAESGEQELPAEEPEHVAMHSEKSQGTEDSNVETPTPDELVSESVAVVQPLEQQELAGGSEVVVGSFEDEDLALPLEAEPELDIEKPASTLEEGQQDLKEDVDVDKVSVKDLELEPKLDGSVSEQQLESEPIPEPVVEPAVEPVVEPVSEPVVEESTQAIVEEPESGKVDEKPGSGAAPQIEKEKDSQHEAVPVQLEDGRSQEDEEAKDKLGPMNSTSTERVIKGKHNSYLDPLKVAPGFVALEFGGSRPECVLEEAKSGGNDESGEDEMIVAEIPPASNRLDQDLRQSSTNEFDCGTQMPSESLNEQSFYSKQEAQTGLATKHRGVAGTVEEQSPGQPQQETHVPNQQLPKSLYQDIGIQPSNMVPQQNVLDEASPVEKTLAQEQGNQHLYNQGHDGDSLPEAILQSKASNEILISSNLSDDFVVMNKSRGIPQGTGETLTEDDLPGRQLLGDNAHEPSSNFEATHELSPSSKEELHQMPTTEKDLNELRSNVAHNVLPSIEEEVKSVSDPMTHGSSDLQTGEQDTHLTLSDPQPLPTGVSTDSSDLREIQGTQTPSRLVVPGSSVHNSSPSVEERDSILEDTSLPENATESNTTRDVLYNLTTSSQRSGNHSLAEDDGITPRPQSSQFGDVGKVESPQLILPVTDAEGSQTDEGLILAKGHSSPVPVDLLSRPERAQGSLEGTTQDPLTGENSATRKPLIKPVAASQPGELETQGLEPMHDEKISSSQAQRPHDMTQEPQILASSNDAEDKRGGLIAGFAAGAAALTAGAGALAQKLSPSTEKLEEPSESKSSSSNLIHQPAKDALIRSAFRSDLDALQSKNLSSSDAAPDVPMKSPERSLSPEPSISQPTLAISGQEDGTAIGNLGAPSSSHVPPGASTTSIMSQSPPLKASLKKHRQVNAAYLSSCEQLIDLQQTARVGITKDSDTRPTLARSGTQTEDDYESSLPASPTLDGPAIFTESRSFTPGIVLPDLADPTVKALGRARSLRRSRRRTIKRNEETVAAAVIIYAAARELSPSPSSRLGSPQAERNIGDVLELDRGDKSVMTPGVAGVRGVDLTNVDDPVTDLLADEGKKSSSDRRRRHRHSSSRSGETESSDAKRDSHHRSRRASDASSKSATSDLFIGPRTPKRSDSGFSADSSHSSKRQRTPRTPEEQVAHDRRKEERRALRDIERQESKGKDPEIPRSDRHSHSSSKRHSQQSVSSRSERSSKINESPVTSKKFFDLKGGQSAVTPNFSSRASDSAVPRVAKDSARPDAAKRSHTSRETSRTSGDVTRPREHRSSRDHDLPREHRSSRNHDAPREHRSSRNHDEPREHKSSREHHHHKHRDRSSADKIKTTSRSATNVEADSPSASKPIRESKESREEKHHRREERQRTRDAEAKKKQAPSGFKGMIKKIFA
ncbi:hypothetical protein SUNI508_10571 [Seiridium unicorne]|uniref:Uncharacterized protein n=1 Tax=Seiridium unicorne TaxID=138068 RepID=A0ABR2ULF0_9PEZI